MNHTHHEKTRCICCNGKSLRMLLDLKDQPLANSFHSSQETPQPFPLKLNLCTDCFHLQLSHIVNPDLLFKNYLYVSGTTKTLKDYFKWFAEFVSEIEPNSLSVLDIACNDGSQLDAFYNIGYDTYGIDPAENLYEISSKKNHKIVCDYFSSKSIFTSCRKMKMRHTYDIIVAQNVFAHTENAKEFLDSCCDLMHQDSLLFIQTSQAEMIQRNQFDTIYHEHISFFSINSMNELLKRTKLRLLDVVKTPIHGVSNIFIIGTQKFSHKKYGSAISNLIDMEKAYGLHDIDTYLKYTENVESIVEDFVFQIESAKKLDTKVVGYGAAAKGNTLLNYANVKLDFIIDDNPLKQELLTPGQNILIMPVDHLKLITKPVLFVPLAWNFFDEIRTRIKKVRVNPQDRFLQYFPEVKIIC